VTHMVTATIQQIIRKIIWCDGLWSNL